MNAVMVYGSPNKKDSASYRLGSSFGKGLETSGWQTSEIVIYDKEISHCLGCKSCWSATPGKCVQNDDMAGILDLLSKANLVVMAVPLYFFMVPGKTKDYLDRHMPMFYQTVLKMYGKATQDWIDHIKFVLIGVCGYPQKSYFGGMKLSFQHIFGKAYAADFFVTNSAGLSADKNCTEFKEYYQMMEKLGTEFGKDMKVSAQTMAEFEKLTEMDNPKIADMRERLAKLQNS